MFKVKGFDQEFKNIKEYEEAERLRRKTEAALALEKSEVSITRITATVVPASEETLEKAITSIQSKLSELSQKVDEMGTNPTQEDPPGFNKQGLPFGLTLTGQSCGIDYSLDVIEDGYLCSNGKIYDTLSGAALGASGNRRSGWRFWRTAEGIQIGEITGRFKKDEHAPALLQRTPHMS